MKILVIGSGAREHAMVWKLSRERDVTEILCAPGNPGIAALARCIPADLTKPAELLAVASREPVDLTVVGPEVPLSHGVVDLFAARGRAIVGPTRADAARKQQGVRERLHGASRSANGALPGVRIG